MRYSLGHITPTPNNTYRARITVNGARHYKNLKTIQDARDWIDALAINAYRSPRTLSPDQYHDALRALDALPPGSTLFEAARAYAQAKPQTPSPQHLTTADAIHQFIQDKAQAGRRKSHITTLRTYLRKLQPDQPLHAWTPKLLTTIVCEMHPTTRNNAIRAFHNLFEWALHRGYVPTNPATHVTRAIQTPGPPGIISPNQLRDLLEAARRTDPGLIPYISIGAFAGIRASELRQLDHRDVDLHAGHIHVNAHAAKTRQQRYVDIHPTLRRWLTPNTTKEGRICPQNIRKRLTAVKTLAKIQSWPTNALRHSYATYHLAAYQDAGKTAHQLGHTNPQLLYNHYRNLATKQQALAWFNTRPGSRCGKLLGK